LTAVVDFFGIKRWPIPRERNVGKYYRLERASSLERGKIIDVWPDASLIYRCLSAIPETHASVIDVAILPMICLFRGSDGYTKPFN
jgi:hypothetical protein